jgi:tetratricopeptide (TPR) repeat protein
VFMVNVARNQLSDKDLRPKALNDLEQLIKSPDKAAAIAAAGTLGGNAFLDKDVDRAVRALEAGLLIDGENVELNNNLAYVLCVAQKQPAKALQYALKAADKDPNNPNILDTLGVIYLELTPPQLDKAEETLNRARAIAPDGPTRTMPTVHLIQVKLKKGARAEAESLLQELKTLQETEPRVKKTYGRDIEEIIKSMQPTP